MLRGGRPRNWPRKLNPLKKTNLQLMKDDKRDFLEGTNRVLGDLRQSTRALNVEAIFNSIT